MSAKHLLYWPAQHVKEQGSDSAPGQRVHACDRRVLTEWLQGEASETGLAAVATSGAGAIVEAAAASAQLEVSDTAACELHTPNLRSSLTLIHTLHRAGRGASAHAAAYRQKYGLGVAARYGCQSECIRTVRFTVDKRSEPK